MCIHMYLYIYICVFISNHVSTTSDAPNNTISVDMLDKIIEPIWLNLCCCFFDGFRSFAGIYGGYTPYIN